MADHYISVMEIKFPISELPLGEVGVGNASGIFVRRGALGQDIGHVAHLAHELGHQWIAGMLPVDTSNSFFLQEGLTEYTAYQYLAEWSLGQFGSDLSLARRRIGLAPSSPTPLSYKTNVRNKSGKL